jgi:hypothetical protein
MPADFHGQILRPHGKLVHLKGAPRFRQNVGFDTLILPSQEHLSPFNTLTRQDRHELSGLTSRLRRDHHRGDLVNLGIGEHPVPRHAPCRLTHTRPARCPLCRVTITVVVSPSGAAQARVAATRRAIRASGSRCRAGLLGRWPAVRAAPGLAVSATTLQRRVLSWPCPVRSARPLTRPCNERDAISDKRGTDVEIRYRTWLRPLQAPATKENEGFRTAFMLWDYAWM